MLLVNRQQPEGYRVADRTLREWRSSGTLKIRGYARACGTRGIHRRAEDDVPLYLWSDVERLRAAKPQKVATGAAALGSASPSSSSVRSIRSVMAIA